MPTGVKDPKEFKELIKNVTTVELSDLLKVYRLNQMQYNIELIDLAAKIKKILLLITIINNELINREDYE